MKHTRHLPASLHLAAALVAILAATPAFAGGPLANCSSGQPYLWANGGANIPFNPDQGNLGPLTNAQAVALVQEAFDVWGAIPTATLSYVNAGFLPVDVNITNWVPYYDAPAPDGLSAIVFDDTGEIFDLLFGPGSGVLGFAGPEWGTPATCTITEGLSFLNGPAFTDVQYARDVMVHEFGHYTNFAHTVVNGQIYLGSVGGDNTGPTPHDTFGAPPHPLLNDIVETMYPFYYGPGIGTDSLEADDIAIASTMYPAPGFLAGTGTISGAVLAANGTTRLSGANVIARNVANPFFDAVSAISGDFTDSTSQADPLTGVYTINGLTPGATYAVYVDEILAGGFSTAPLAFPGPEEFWDANESSSNPPDDPSVYTGIPVAAGVPVTGLNIVFNVPAPGDPLAVGDDGSVQLPLPFTYTLCGQRFDSVFVNANGNITFGAANADFSESASEMRSGPPRIAGWWDDLNPSAGGLVTYEQTGNAFTVIYQDVPEFPNTGANTFRITLARASNHIDIQYGAMSAVDGLAGVSCGGAVTSGFEQPSDLSAFGRSRINLHNQPALYEVFTTASPNDLAFATVRFNGTTNYEDNWLGPNDTLSKARRITLPFDSIPVVRYTEIEPAGNDVDFFRFTAAGGTTLVAEILTGGIDSYVGLFDSAGNLIATDDDSGPGLLSRIVFPVPANGTYYLAVTTYPDTGFTGAGAGEGRYVLNVFTIVGTLLTLGDDSSVQVTLPFTFTFQGQTYADVFVNANGNLTFGSGDTDFSESVAEFLNDQPRIAPLWDDLSPNNGGLVIVDGNAGSWTVSFVGVPEFVSTGSNTFSVTLQPSGQVTIAYGAVSALDGLAGVSPGGGAADPGESDLSSSGSWPVAGVTYELFNAAGPFDLSGMTLLFLP